MAECNNFSKQFRRLRLQGFSIVRQKKVAKLKSDIRNTIAERKCLLCGKEVSSLCNSHFIPRFTLEKIDEKGMLLQSSSVLDLPEQVTELKKAVGTSNAGTFMLICRECDKQVFADYENPQNYEKALSQQILLQIALKNYLKYFSKRKYEIELAKRAVAKTSNDYFRKQVKLYSLDIQEYRRMINNKLKKNVNRFFELFYFKKLNYIVPIASQTQVVLIGDLSDNLINNIYCESSHYHLKELYLFIFPLESFSVVGMFYDLVDKRYRKFVSDFNKLEEDDKLQVINYILLRYSEDYFLSPQIDDEIKKQIKGVVDKGSDIVSSSNAIYDALKDHSLSNRFDIPNLLDKKYAIG